MSQHYALRIDLEFKNKLSYCDDEINKIIASIHAVRDGVTLGMHTEKTVCMVFVSRESAIELMARLKPIFAELHAVNNFWCGDCPDNFEGMNGSLDAAAEAIHRAWRTASFLTATTEENVGDTKGRKRPV
jgi:hypothetical protein